MRERARERERERGGDLLSEQTSHRSIPPPIHLSTAPPLPAVLLSSNLCAQVEQLVDSQALIGCWEEEEEDRPPWSGTTMSR